MSRSAYPLRAALVAAALLVGCGADSVQAVRNGAPPDEPRDQGVGVSDRLIEDFDNQQLVYALQGAATLDVNQGVLTLPVETFPRVDGEGLDMFATRVEHNGLVEASEIVVAEGGSLEASDAVEMRALDVVRISGTIRAGRGGVTLMGGRGVYVDGTIESRGPVRILVEAADGEIEISGRIAVHASADDIEETPPHVELLGRGAVRISGQIESTADPGRPGGDVRARVYGPVKVQGPLAHISTTSALEGTPGDIRLRSETSVTLGEGARVGRAAYEPDEDLVPGGNVEVQSIEVRIEGGARVEAGDGMLKGGSIFLSAREALALDGQSAVRSGAGPEGGSIIMKAHRIGLGQGSVLEAGQGRSYGAHFEISAVDRLDVGGSAIIRGGPTSCGPGGNVNITVGGEVRVRDGAEVRGGDGAVDFGDRVCMSTAVGGAVLIQARDATGVENAVLPGQGFPDGEVEVLLDEETTVLPPNLTVGTSGQLLSKIIDRGVAAVGQRPELLDQSTIAPEGTRVTIELCAAAELDGPYEPCFDANDPEALEAVRPMRYFRYRIGLLGRVFDAPVLDYFELDFSPED